MIFFFTANEIGDEGIKALAEALKTNVSLIELDLDSDNVCSCS